MKIRSIQTKLLLAGALSGAAVVVICVAFMLYMKEQNTQLVGLNTAQAITNQIGTLRVFYADEVVSRAKQAGMKADYNFAQTDNTLPLPATMVKVLGDQIARNYPGTVVRLYSR